MEFQIKENMRLAPIVRLESELLQQAATDLDQFLYSEVCMLTTVPGMCVPDASNY
jgi:hypothetical protein